MVLIRLCAVCLCCLQQIRFSGAKTHIDHTDTRILVPSKIPHFFFCPGFHHFAWVVFTVTMTKAEFTCHIFVSIFENQYGCFVNL